MGQSKMDNPETRATLGTRHRTMTKQNKNTTQKTKKPGVNPDARED